MASDDLATPAGTIHALRAFGIRPRKRWGQHFLVSRRALDQILAASDLTGQDTVLEIGAGLGTLTAALARCAGRVVAVEIDRALRPALQAAVGSCPNVQTVIGDVQTLDIAALLGSGAGPRKVVANLPYNVASALIVALLEPSLRLQRMVVTVQREVADRLAAPPGTKDYGVLTVAAQFRAETTLVTTLPASAFMPPPDVESAVVRLDRREHPVCAVRDEGMFFRVVRAAFSQRRKTVRNALAGGYPMSTSDAEAACLQAGIAPGRRGETMGLVEFAALADAVGRVSDRSNAGAAREGVRHPTNSQDKFVGAPAPDHQRRGGS